MINLNELNNVQLIAFVEQSLVQYQAQKEMTNSHTMQVYGGIGGRELAIMEKALDRCAYLNPESMETKKRVSDILARDFAPVIHRPSPTIPLHEVYAKQKLMSGRHNFHDVRTIDRSNPFDR